MKISGWRGTLILLLSFLTHNQAWALEFPFGNGADGAEEFVRELSIDVMEAHIKATNESVARGDRGWLPEKEVDDYHRIVFDKHGLSEMAYGGWWTPGSYYCPDCRPEPLPSLDADCLGPRMVWGCVP